MLTYKRILTPNERQETFYDLYPDYLTTVSDEDLADEYSNIYFRYMDYRTTREYDWQYKLVKREIEYRYNRLYNDRDYQIMLHMAKLSGIKPIAKLVALRIMGV